MASGKREAVDGLYLIWATSMQGVAPPVSADERTERASAVFWKLFVLCAVPTFAG